MTNELQLINQQAHLREMKELEEQKLEQIKKESRDQRAKGFMHPTIAD